MFDQWTTDAQLAAAQVLALLERPGPLTGWQPILDKFDSNLLKIAEGRDTGSTGKWVILSNEVATYWILGGMTGPLQLRAVLESGGFGMVPWRGMDVFAAWSDYAEIVLNAVDGVPQVQTRRHVVIGHSMGGAAATLLATQVKQLPNAQSTALLTFGSPKVGSESVQAALFGVQWTRLVNEADPVPYLPPPLTEGLLDLRYAARAPQNLILRSFGLEQQKPRAESMYPATRFEGAQRETVYEDTDPGRSFNLFDALVPGTFISSWNNYHAIQQYELSIRAAQRVNSPLYSPSKMADIPKQVRRVDVPQRRATSRLQAALDLGVRVMPMHYLQQTTKLPVDECPHGQKFGPAFVVEWQGELICLTRNLSKARTIAKRLRALLVKMQQCDEFRQANFAAAWSSYLPKAATPGIGFAPILNLV